MRAARDLLVLFEDAEALGVGHRPAAKRKEEHG